MLKFLFDFFRISVEFGYPLWYYFIKEKLIIKKGGANQMESNYKIKITKEELKILSSIFPNMRVLEFVSLVINQNKK